MFDEDGWEFRQVQRALQGVLNYEVGDRSCEHQVLEECAARCAKCGRTRLAEHWNQWSLSEYVRARCRGLEVSVDMRTFLDLYDECQDTCYWNLESAIEFGILVGVPIITRAAGVFTRAILVKVMRGI